MAPGRSAASLALCFIIQWSGYTWACWPGYRVSLQAGVSEFVNTALVVSEGERQTVDFWEGENSSEFS